MFLRRYRPTDHDEVLELHRMGMEQWLSSAGPGPWNSDLHNIEEVYFNAGEFLVGQQDGRIVAMGALRKVDQTTGEIKRMRVHPEAQRQGLGQIVLNRLERLAKEIGYEKLVLDTTTELLAAQAFYNKNGYSETRRADQGFGEKTFRLIYYEKGIV